jgi:hypothetical protein
MIGIAIANSIGIRRSSSSAPVVPIATAATGIGQTSFTANWNAFTGASYYLLDVSLNSSFSSFVGSYQNFVVLSTSQLVSGLTASTTYYYRLRAATGVDADAAAFFSRVYTAGGALSYTEVSATETLVSTMKADGIWTAMRAVYPMVGASAAACAQNLKSASFTGAFFGGVTFASTGITSNGTTGYFGTTYNPSVSGLLDSAHLSVYSRTNNGGANVDFGSNAPAHFLTYNFGNFAGLNSNDSPTFSTFPTSDGMLIGSRTVSTEARFFHKGGAAVVSTRTSTSRPNQPLSLCALNNNGSNAFFTTREYAFASIGDGLTDTQAGNFYTAVQAFQTTLSRQI